jgi:hypothetical protein
MNETPTVDKEIIRGLKMPLISSSPAGFTPDLDHRRRTAKA